MAKSAFLPTPPAGAVNKVKTVPAPTGGLNARDSLANMPESDAITLVNWWPQPYGVTVRPGYRQWATQLPGTVGTLAQWASDTGEDKLFAWAGTDVDGFGIYDVSTRAQPNSPAPVPLIEDLSSGIWHTTQMTNAAGVTLIAVNGLDAGIIYDGASVVRIAYDALPPPTPQAANTWYGLDSAEVVHVTTHQGRLWATKKDSGLGYFLKDVNTLFGEWDYFDFGALFTKGGYITYMTTWTIDDGNGAEDHLVVASSQGQVAVYGGTDPQDDTKWALVGLYFVGIPAPGRRSHVKVGGDMVLLTQRGLMSMSDLLTSTKVNAGESNVKSEKVQLLISALVSATNLVDGWELYVNASENVLLVNIPSTAVGGARQLAANQVTSASPWTIFSGIDATCWLTFEGGLFFGDSNGRVCQAWVGGQDDVDLGNDNGKDITTQVQQAYSYLGSMAVQKQVGMYRPNFLSYGGMTYNSRIEYDFLVRPVGPPTGGAITGQSIWGAYANAALWGPGADAGVWGGSLVPDRRWIMAEGLGTAASLRMTTVSFAEVVWVSTDYSYTTGTLL